MNFTNNLEECLELLKTKGYHAVQDITSSDLLVLLESDDYKEIFSTLDQCMSMLTEALTEDTSIAQLESSLEDYLKILVSFSSQFIHWSDAAHENKHWQETLVTQIIDQFSAQKNRYLELLYEIWKFGTNAQEVQPLLKKFFG